MSFFGPSYFGPAYFGSYFGGAKVIADNAKFATLVVSSLIIPEKKTGEGILIKSTSLIWDEIVKVVGDDWSKVMEIPPEKWEEVIAGAFKRAGYDEVTWTPRSGDHGRDVIAIKHGLGSVKILGSVKRYKPGHLVDQDAVRALYGVVAADNSASKGIITTTSDFAPKMLEDPLIRSLVPTRIELINGPELQAWLKSLAEEQEKK